MGRDLFWVQGSRLSFEYVGAGFTIIVCCYPNVTKPALTDFCINWNME